MEWLMGKARGVGRGLNHAPTALTITDSINTVTHSSSPTNGAVSINSFVCSDYDFKGPKDVISSEDQRTYSSSSYNNMDNFQTLQAKLNKTDNKQKNYESNSNLRTPKYTDKCYLNQQLPLSPDSTYPEFSTIVEPFPCMDTNEWLAAHAIALFDNLSTIFDAIYDLCDCHTLLDSAADNGLQNVCSSLLSDFFNNSSIVYLLQGEDDRSKKCKGSSGIVVSQVNKICARSAIDGALSSCHDLIQSSRIFPVRNGEQFPNDLPQYVSTICKILLVCILHIYFFHIYHLDQLELIPHMNTLSRHFFAFNKRFSLVEDKYLDLLAFFDQINAVSDEHAS